LDIEEEYYSSPDDEQDFLERQFTETYDNLHGERLNSMSKSTLVQEYIALEERMEVLQKSLHQEQEKNVAVAHKYSVTSDLAPEISDLHTDGESSLAESSATASMDLDDDQDDNVNLTEAEIRRLFEENQKLRRENARLRTMSENSSSEVVTAEDSPSKSSLEVPKMDIGVGPSPAITPAGSPRIAAGGTSPRVGGTSPRVGSFGGTSPAIGVN